MENETLNQPETPQTPPAEAPKTMEVPVEKMQFIFDQMEALTKRLDDKDKEIMALENSVSAQRLAESKANLDKDRRQRVHFKKLLGKVVVGWPETMGEEKINEWIFSPNNPTSPVGEILKCRFYFLDGTKSDMLDQIQLTRSTQQEYARVIEDQGDFVMVEFENPDLGKEPLKVHKKYLNA